ncbi:MAG: hypothetical protein ACLGI9_07570 [Thermoanaerobaculia bacterium]
MSGIANYYHGEQGVAREISWWPAQDKLFLRLDLEGDPHRAFALDYGSDIAIDPAIRPRDHVVYIRLDNTCGVWVHRADQFTYRLEE